MIGVALHLMALVPAAVAARVTRAALGLLCRAPQGSEVERLAEEVDVLRGERDTARLEHAAAVEVCDELRRRVLDAVDTRERLEASDLAAEETGGIKRLDLLVEALEAWDKLVEAVTP